MSKDNIVTDFRDLPKLMRKSTEEPNVTELMRMVREIHRKVCGEQEDDVSRRLRRQDWPYKIMKCVADGKIWATQAIREEFAKFGLEISAVNLNVKLNQLVKEGELEKLGSNVYRLIDKTKAQEPITEGENNE